MTFPSGRREPTNNESHRPSPNDEKLKATIFRIIEVFFAANPDILLYICETGDGRLMGAAALGCWLIAPPSVMGYMRIIR